MNFKTRYPLTASVMPISNEAMGSTPPAPPNLPGHLFRSTQERTESFKSWVMYRDRTDTELRGGRQEGQPSRPGGHTCSNQPPPHGVRSAPRPGTAPGSALCVPWNASVWSVCSEDRKSLTITAFWEALQNPGKVIRRQCMKRWK